jgi:hypothetical protein
MWKDEIELRFFWASMKDELEKILYELVKAEEEEDAGIYLLMMHYDHAREEETPSLPDKEKILEKLSVLVGESRRHQKLLQGMIERLEKGGIQLKKEILQ